jgi:hypothetical protein
MFLFHLRDALTFVGVFSLPLALLELQLMIIGLLEPVVITPTYIVVTIAVGAISFAGAALIEYFD